jgi:hypothetical protein
MEDPAAAQPTERVPSRRLQGLGVRAGRVTRWLICSVVLATAPIMLSFVFLPLNVSITSFLAHGDLAVLALALVSAALGELIGPDHPLRWWHTVLSLVCVTFALFLMALLAGIAGHAPRLTAGDEAKYSVLALIIAVVVGAASWWSTTPKVNRRLPAENAEEVAERSMQ